MCGVVHERMVVRPVLSEQPQQRLSTNSILEYLEQQRPLYQILGDEAQAVLRAVNRFIRSTVDTRHAWPSHLGVTLNIASDYRTSGLYRTHNPKLP